MASPPPPGPPPEAPPPPPPEPPLRRRPIYYPVGWGCLFWLVLIVLAYIIVGFLFTPIWYPWWWR